MSATTSPGKTKSLLTGHTGFKGGRARPLAASKGVVVRRPQHPTFNTTLGNLQTDARIPRHRRPPRPHPKSRHPRARPTQLRPPRRLPHGRPAARPPYADPIGTYETNVLGTARVPRRHPPHPMPGPRRRLHHHRQGLREPRKPRRPLRRDRSPGGHDPHLLQGLRRNRLRRLPTVLLPGRPPCRTSRRARHRPRRVSSSAAATGPPTASSPTSSAALSRPASPSPHPPPPRHPPLAAPRPRAPPRHTTRQPNTRFRKPAPFATAYNFGSHDDDAREVAWIAEKMTAFWGDGARWVLSTKIPASTAFGLPCIRRLESRGRPRLTLHLKPETALQWLVEVLRRPRGNQNDMNSLTLNQTRNMRRFLPEIDLSSPERPKSHHLKQHPSTVETCATWQT